MEKLLFTDEMVELIRKFINERLNSDDLKDRFQNRILKDEVLDILDLYCTVIYYPYDHESNHGFHINDIPDSKGKYQHFVYINTAQCMDRQVFTAAHELGHIWKVDEYIQKACNISIDDSQAEAIINRFAAELLMPKDIFINFFNYAYKERLINEDTITIQGALEIIVVLMNTFMVPFKSVVLRFAELKIFDDSVINLFQGKDSISSDKINNDISDIIDNYGYEKLKWKSKRKFISGLSELLEEAEKMGNINQVKITELRNRFEIKTPSIDSSLDVKVNPVKDNDNDNR